MRGFKECSEKECNILSLPHIGQTCCISCYETLKGGIHLSATGYITVRAYTSQAQIPIKDAAITITDASGDAIAMRLTDRSGKIPPIAIAVPDLSASLSPDSGVIPFTTINIYARAQNFEGIEAENVQIFADTVTTQNLEMIPLAELPASWTKAEIFRTPPQNL